MEMLVMFMSRWRLSWLLWMAVGTPFTLLGFLLDVLVSFGSHAYGMWNYEWRNIWSEWFTYFGERHRRSLHSLGSRPGAGGVLWHRRDDDPKMSWGCKAAMVRAPRGDQ